MWHLRRAIRQRLRDWPASLSFVAVIGAAIAVAGAWVAIARPLLPSALPFPGATRLLAIESWKQGQTGGVTWNDIEDLRTESVEFAAVWLPRTWGLQTIVHGPVEVVLSQQVTGEFFRTLGVEPSMGVPMSGRHEQPGEQNWVWFSHESWQRLLGGVAELADRTIWLNAASYRVAGVLPRGFDCPHDGMSPDIYIPLNRADYWGARGAGALRGMVRMKPGTTAARLQSELDARSRSLAERFPATNRGLLFRATGLSASFLGDRLRLLRWLLAAVSILLVVAVSNAGGIWLAQWLKQQRSASIRLCLGASRRALFAEQAAQALVLGAAAAGTGLVGAEFLLQLLHRSSLLGPELGRFEVWRKAALDPVTLSGMTALSLAASLVSVALPLLAVRGASLLSRTAAHSRTATSRSSRRVRTLLAVAQLTLTGILVYTGTVVWRNVQTFLRADRGFRTEQVLISGIGIPEARYDTDEKMIRFHQKAIQELSRIPGVLEAAGGVSLPVGSSRTRFLLDGESLSRAEQRTAAVGHASPGLLRLLGIPLRRGRLFTSSDRWDTARVALVNQAFADRYLSGEKDPLGHRLRVSFYNGNSMKPYAEHRIVGIIGDSLNRDLALQAEPQIILAADQVALEGFTYFLRSPLPADTLRGQVQRAIWNVDPEIQRVGLRPLSAQVEQALVSRRTVAWLAGLFGAVSMLIVAFGLAASLSATFLESTRDLGIRAALGASPLRLMVESVKWGAVAVTASLTLTLPVSIAVSRLLVLDRKPQGWDPVSWLWAGAALGLIAMAAALRPARKAAALDPLVTLRAD